jgi:hypothetical protein
VKIVATALLFGCLTSVTATAQTQFRHEYIADSMPGDQTGVGGIGVGDFDHDGKMDVVAVNRGDLQVYWYNREADGKWTRHLAGKLSSAQLGMTIMDVDGDGWLDVVVGGVWLRNPQNPRQQPFIPYTYDSKIKTEMHDVVPADVDGDGKIDIVATGDLEGLYWYKIPADPREPWQRTTVTLEVLKQNVDLHGGFAPHGVGDLNGDGHPDIVLADRWLENQDRGQRWVAHRIEFGHRGPFGVSARSWIADVNGDGHNDIIMTDSDAQNSGVAWLENDGKPNPGFGVHYLANRAPGTRGSFHALWYQDMTGDGLKDILVVEQEDPTIPPIGATPRWYLFRRLPGPKVEFEEEVILDNKLGGHDIRVADMNGDGTPDIVSKNWYTWKDNGDNGRAHIDILWNETKAH